LAKLYASLNTFLKRYNPYKLFFILASLLFATVPQVCFAEYDIHTSAKAMLGTILIIVTICGIVAAAIQFFKRQPAAGIVIIVICAVLVFFGFEVLNGGGTSGGALSNVGKAISDFLFGSGSGAGTGTTP
jgi:hypothetical protein